MMKKCAADSERLESCKTARLRLDVILVFLSSSRCRSHVYHCGFLLFLSENRRVFHGDTELQLTSADVLKMKFALNLQLYTWANSK